MKVQEYIASGILEVYVLGGIEQEQISEVEKMASLHPEVKQEIEKLQEAFILYAEANAVKPPASAKDSIFSKLDNHKAEEITRLGNLNSYSYKFAAAASALLFVISATCAFLFWSKWQNAEQKLVSLQEETTEYANQINKANYKMEQLANSFKVVSDTSVIKVTMKGVPSNPDMVATVFWNKSTNEVFVDPGNLPEAPEGMQYQLWALEGGVPIDAGVFDSYANDFQKVKLIKAAQAYAVTLEKKGGSPTPTMTAMFVFGKV